MPDLSRPPDRPVLIFDGDCGFCRWSVDWLRFFVGTALEPFPAQAFQDQADQVIFDPVDPDAVYLFTDQGHWYRGAEAMFRAAGYNPWLKPFVLPWLIWPFLPLAESVYGWIARNRTRVSRWLGLSSQCSLPQEPD